jgi:hypothetical protein
MCEPKHPDFLPKSSFSHRQSGDQMVRQGIVKAAHQNSERELKSRSGIRVKVKVTWRKKGKRVSDPQKSDGKEIKNKK